MTVETTPTWITHGTPLPLLISAADALEIDMAMHQDKQPRPGKPLTDGREQRRQDNALRLQIQYASRDYP